MRLIQVLKVLTNLRLNLEMDTFRKHVATTNPDRSEKYLSQYLSEISAPTTIFILREHGFNERASKGTM